MSDASPTTVNRTLPRRLANSAYRVREYLTEKEVERLIDAARRRGRNGTRDAAAILLAYRHGLRAQELCSLRWAQIDLRNGRLHVNRAKGGIESVHPLHGPELRALRPLQGQSPRIALVAVHQHADATQGASLLRASRERPRGCRAAERGYQFPPSDVDWH